MARYGDLDKLAVKWRLASPTQRQNFGEIIESHPTADVVPKSEVEALECEIARLKKSTLPSYCQAVSEEEAIKIGKEYGKTEVAREIFEEIEKEIEEALKSNYQCKTTCDDVFCRINGKIDALRGMQYFIENLKKKYMEVDDG